MAYVSGLITEIKTQASGAGSGVSRCTGISSAMFITWLNYGRRESQATTTVFTSAGQSITIPDNLYNPLISFAMKRFFEYKAALTNDEVIYRNYIGLAQFYYEQGKNEMETYEKQNGSKLVYGNGLARTEY